MKLSNSFTLLIVCLLSLSAEARNFDIGSESFAGYVGFTGAPSAVGQSAFENEAGANVTYSGKVSYNYSGEFGFVYSRPSVALRFGLEVMKPESLTNVVATGGGGDLYSATSDIMGLTPKFSLEIGLRRDQQSRSFVAGTIGYSTVTIRNSYTLTAAYPGMDTDLAAKGTTVTWNASLGHEMLVTDTTTFVFELGYRRFVINNLKYSDGGNYFGITYVEGDDLKNNGVSREIDLSGIYLGATFRFYM